MKSNKGIGMITLLIIVVIIVAIIGATVHFAILKYNDARVQTIKTDMLLVEWKVKAYIDKQTADKVEHINYVGTKVSDMQEETIIKEFLSKNIISKEEYDKYYVLNDEAMKTAGLEITNYEESYYLINYETYEVIVTQGCKFSKEEILYKLSDIEAKTEVNEEENLQSNEN